MLTNMVGCCSLIPRLLDGQWEWPGNETTKLLLCYVYLYCILVYFQTFRCLQAEKHGKCLVSFPGHSKKLEMEWPGDKAIQHMLKCWVDSTQYTVITHLPYLSLSQTHPTPLGHCVREP